MPKHSLAHTNLAWAKRKLDELDATLAGIEASAKSLEGKVRKEADSAIERMKAARARFRAEAEAALSEAKASTETVKDLSEKARERLDAQWAAADAAFHDFLNATGGKAEAVRTALAARAQAQRRTAEAQVEEIQTQVNKAINKARVELDAETRRLAAETEKIEAKLGQVSGASAESWKALKKGLADMRAVHDATWKSIAESLTKVVEMPAEKENEAADKKDD